MTTKTCSRCDQVKPVSEFYKQKGGAQGRRGRCKECYKGRAAAWAKKAKVQAAPAGDPRAVASGKD